MAAAGGDEGLGAGALRGVLELFERLRERPTRRARERLRPLLFLLGPAARTRRAAKLLKERCESERAPASHIAADTSAAGISGVLREAMHELSQSACRPRWEPALRFPHLEMALWLRDLREIRLAGDPQPPRNASRAERENHRLVHNLTNPPVGDNESARRRELGRVIRRRGRDVLRDIEEGRRGRISTFLGFLEQIAPIGVAVVAVVSAGTAAAVDLAAAMLAGAVGLAFVAVQVLARTRGWYGVLRYGWFRRQPYLSDGSPDFLSFALGVLDPRPVEPDDHAEQLDLLLVAAFLEDLRRNYRRGIRRAAWARVRYPVVIFERLAAGHVGVAFVETVERVRADAQRSSDQRVFDPLVVVAGVDPAEPADVGSPHPSGPRLVDRLARTIRVEMSSGEPEDAVAAGRLWGRYLGEQRRVRVLGTRRELRVDLAADPGGDPPPVRPGRRRPRVAHPLLPWIAMLAVLAGSISVISVNARRYCAAFQIIRTESGECVGITDGSYTFGGTAPAGGHVNRMKPVLDRIERLNDEVLRSGKDYITIVYLGPVTADPSTRNRQLDLLAGAQGELVGVSIEQQRFNDGSPDLRLRVLVANAGARFRYGAQVAGQIRDLALRDRSIVAVVGFEQSREQTRAAIRVLSKAALPMIGTANSFEAIARLESGAYSPYFFRLAPTNGRLARHAAYWAAGGRLGKRAGTVDVIYDDDPDDLYSRDLAHRFQAEFTAARPGGTVRMSPYRHPSDVARATMAACRDAQDVFYYAGRSDEFPTFVNTIEQNCGRSDPVVLADDEIAKYVSDHPEEIGGKGYRLFYTPLALREAWTPAWVGPGRQPQTFYSDYRRIARDMSGGGDAAERRPSETRAAVSYDAAALVTNVAKQVYGEQKSVPTPSAVFAALTDQGRDALPKGASGVVRFVRGPTGHVVEQKPVLLATVRGDGALEVREVCGRLVAGGQVPADCPPAR
ncbi:hypothetical protein GCM10023085_79120 [Actinomadura viridis]|uniref:ABC-type branched-subunit amino acid transport system substrate-binding protein n=1 Tax=Actinomadura viridis TaxID=58110 RepID=A0A931GUR3_9ACTN|nr:hypothetical protein [Actinomadura viridis]MBG6093439.1 ABC-type branched-subunit amino acid transport system substrate-binding protein [Actinomadura viridis]